jgi:chromosomal replication initiation ATPase DnaA
MKAMMENDQPQEQTVSKETPAPTEEEIRAKWPELALRYKHLDRLCSMLNTTTLSVSDAEDGCKKVVFQVVNEAQKAWVEAKMLHDIEGNLRAILKSMKVYLRVEVTPDDTPQEKTPYMPSEKAKELMDNNPEVKGLVKDLVLDIK